LLIHVEQDAARILHLSPRTLQRYRKDGCGPKFVRRGKRFVGYTDEAIVDWIAQHTHRKHRGRMRRGGEAGQSRRGRTESRRVAITLRLVAQAGSAERRIPVKGGSRLAAPIPRLDENRGTEPWPGWVAGPGTPAPCIAKGPRGSLAALPDPQQNRDYGLQIVVFFLPFQRIASTFHV